MEGTINSRIGPVISPHIYKVPSISVFLDTHVIYMLSDSIEPFHSLCSVENGDLIGQQSATLRCEIQVSLRPGSKTISSASCDINCANESECASRIYLDFHKLKLLNSESECIPLTVKYNVTALGINSGQPLRHVLAQIVNPSDFLQPVYLYRRQDVIWNNYKVGDTIVLRMGAPQLSSELSFFLYFEVNSTLNIETAKFE
ncbi:unnamed protein product [Protopolystoma xenopodis]|uniref:DUF5735 domain-containing protein n=1 Tax=Protopolystoma xenopodis TaxID=117903 RepID=A0A448X4M6_9PLAT|nr:unnamed protein product [Protopolystoma xenopodis]